MKFINEWTYTVCITLIFSVMFSLLLPKGSQGKVGKIVITVFIMISFILPFKANGFNFDIDEYESISNVEIDSKEVKDFLFEKLGINAKVYYIGE